MNVISQKPYLVGISGGSGSGKTSFIKKLVSELGTENIAIVSQDNYYFPMDLQKKDKNGKINFDLPTAIDRQSFFNDIQKISSGLPIQKLEYTFNNKMAKPQWVEVFPAPIIVMEGLFIFHFEEMRAKLDLKVYIDVEDEIKLQRRLNRDRLERGYPEDEVLYQWANHAMPSYRQFLVPFTSRAHIIINNNDNFEKGLTVLANHLKHAAVLQNQLTMN